MRYALGELRALEAHVELHDQRGNMRAARERLEELQSLFLRLQVPAEAARVGQAIAALSHGDGAVRY
jgi:hypothetical protein